MVEDESREASKPSKEVPTHTKDIVQDSGTEATQKLISRQTNLTSNQQVKQDNVSSKESMATSSTAKTASIASAKQAVPDVDRLNTTATKPIMANPTSTKSTKSTTPTLPVITRITNLSPMTSQRSAITKTSSIITSTSTNTSNRTTATVANKSTLAINTGNDRVTVDSRPKQPLVASQSVGPQAAAPASLVANGPRPVNPLVTTTTTTTPATSKVNVEKTPARPSIVIQPTPRPIVVPQSAPPQQRQQPQHATMKPPPMMPAQQPPNTSVKSAFDPPKRLVLPTPGLPPVVSSVHGRSMAAMTGNTSGMNPLLAATQSNPVPAMASMQSMHNMHHPPRGMVPMSSSSSMSPTSALGHIKTISPQPMMENEEQVAARKAQLIRQTRAPLTDPYAPYIIDADTCVADARKRLRDALEQTRQLRAAFTERVYGKYRVCLAPPSPTSDVLSRIRNNPQMVRDQLLITIKSVKDEKEIEKRESTKLNAELAALSRMNPAPAVTPTAVATTTTPTATNTSTAVPPEGSPPGIVIDPTTSPAALLNADNADQLMYVSAGLSLVILPEQDVTGKVDMSCYPDRAPINPENGHRVKGISLAAAAAGEVILDRTRKAAAMRAERHRRQAIFRQDKQQQHHQQLKPPGSQPTSAPPISVDQDYSRLSVLTNASKNLTMYQPKPPAVPAPVAAIPVPAPAIVQPVAAPPPPIPTVGTTPVIHIPTVVSPAAAALAAIAPTGPTSAKAIRARIQGSMPTSTLLSISYEAEELRSDSHISASTQYLKQRGVCGIPLSKSQLNARYRHPHPDSTGGRKRPTNPVAFRKDFAQVPPANAPGARLHPVYMGLPLVPTAKERRNCPRKKVVDSRKVGTKRARNVIANIAAQFEIPNGASRGGGASDLTKLPAKRRRVTELSVMFGLTKFEDVTSTPDASTVKASKDAPIDDVLALCVLQAVGWVQPSESSGNQGTNEGAFHDRIDTSCFSDLVDSEANPDSYRLKLRNRWNRLIKNKSSLADHFGLHADPADGQDDEEATSTSDTKSQVGVESIRGGGDVLADSSERSFTNPNQTRTSVENSDQKPAADDSKPENAEIASRDNSSQNQARSPVQSPVRGTAQARNMPSQAQQVADIAAQRMMYEQSQHHALMNQRAAQAEGAYNLPPPVHSGSMVPHMNLSAPVGHIQGQSPPPEHFHHRPSTNALQLAHHLQHATNSLSRMNPHGHPMGADLADYIGSLHRSGQPPGGYDWSLNASAAAAAATNNSLAALRLAPSRAAMANFAAQDRARVILAREHQNAAAAAAHRQNMSNQQAAAYLMNNGSHPYAQPNPSHYSHMGNRPPSQALLGSYSNMQQMQARNGRSHLKPKESRSSKKDNKASTDQSRSGDNDSQNSASPSLRSIPADRSGGVARKRKLSEASDEKSTKRAASDDHALSRPPKVPNVASADVASTGTTPKENSSAANRSTTKVPPEGVDKKDSPEARVENLASSQTATTSEIKKHVALPPSIPPKEQRVRKSTPPVVNKPRVVKATTPKRSKGDLHFVVPSVPKEMSLQAAEVIIASRIHDILETGGATIGSAPINSPFLIHYLIAVGTAVPIPKTLIANALKERLQVPTTKSSLSNNLQAIPREVIIASIMIWLWHYHEDTFQMAFTKNGRIDVDPKCKWLISSAIDTSVRVITREMLELGSKSGHASGSVVQSSRSSMELPNTKMDVLVAVAVGKALQSALSIDGAQDTVIPCFHELVEYLDESRRSALYSKSQERTLLANVLARFTQMSLPFSHAYSSSMVRAGEALGHGELFEHAQNEAVAVTTMIPYDVFTDEAGVWEDPCRPIEGFSANLTGDDLLRRAHARAIVQKSLKRLQDRYSIKGGTSSQGPYLESSAHGGGSGDGTGRGKSSSNGSFSRSSSKRSRSSISEPPCPPGLGFAAASSWNQYESRLNSLPLLWMGDDIDNAPYGRFKKSSRPRSFSLSLTAHEMSQKGKGSGRSMSVGSCEPVTTAKEGASMPCSTHEISWVEVAGVFQDVALPKALQREKERSLAAAAAARGTIFAPYVRKIDENETPDIENDENIDSDDEDLSETAVLGRHQAVLDAMKEKMSVVFDATKKQQQQQQPHKKKK